MLHAVAVQVRLKFCTTLRPLESSILIEFICATNEVRSANTGRADIVTSLERSVSPVTRRRSMSMKRNVSRWLAVVVALGALSVAQDRNQPTARSQERITKEVMHELLMLPYYSGFDDIKFKVDGSTVTLLGEAHNPQLKSDAEHAIKNIEGIDRIDNQIDVLPASPFDDRL